MGGTRRLRLSFCRTQGLTFGLGTLICLLSLGLVAQLVRARA
jgi:sulfite exporter TauE/SafE